ncbi:hypothetical protein V6N12_026305 [Hibiscus sabdariffa]|uniref:Uncharacterized protein n=1 Tax=Hibiscus sabdariffa TaxID=183260 RepID=A0ABR2DRD7_9ROSI
MDVRAVARRVPSASSSMQLGLDRVVKLSPPPPPIPRQYITMLAPVPSPLPVLEPVPSPSLGLPGPCS